MSRMGLEPMFLVFEWYKAAGHYAKSEWFAKNRFLIQTWSSVASLWITLLRTLPFRIEENVDIILFSRPFLESDTRMLMVMIHCLHQNLALWRLWTACKHTSTSHERMDMCVNFVFRNFYANNLRFETRLQSYFLFCNFIFMVRFHAHTTFQVKTGANTNIILERLHNGPEKTVRCHRFYLICISKQSGEKNLLCLRRQFWRRKFFLRPNCICSLRI
jgi:hypothetical protein